VSYQREDDRYWTDYLRVALPIIGLLLLVGLLWFWLASIIGDDNNDQPTPTVNTATTVIAAATQTATATTQVVINPTQGAAPTQTTTGEQPAAATNTPGEGGEQPTEGGGAQARFQKGDTVITNDPDVRLRSEPSSASEDTIITSFDEGTELTIDGPSVEGDDGLIWWPVIDPDGNTGYVADDFLDPAE
jgi:hypothetical protein